MRSPWVYAPELSDQAPECVGCGLSKMVGAGRAGERGRGGTCLVFPASQLAGMVASWPQGLSVPSLGWKEL